MMYAVYFHWHLSDGWEHYPNIPDLVQWVRERRPDGWAHTLCDALTLARFTRPAGASVFEGDVLVAVWERRGEGELATYYAGRCPNREG